MDENEVQNWVDKVSEMTPDITQNDLIKWANSFPVKSIKELADLPVYLYGDATLDKAITNIMKGEAVEPNVKDIYGIIRNSYVADKLSPSNRGLFDSNVDDKSQEDTSIVHFSSMESFIESAKKSCPVNSNSCKLSDLYEDMCDFFSTLLYMHHNAIGKDFDTIHSVAKELYEALLDDIDTIAEMAIREGETIKNLTAKRILTESYDLDKFVHEVDSIGCKFIEKLICARNNSSFSNMSKINKMIDYWETEILYKNKARMKTLDMSPRNRLKLAYLSSSVADNLLGEGFKSKDLRPVYDLSIFRQCESEPNAEGLTNFARKTLVKNFGYSKNLLTGAEDILKNIGISDDIIERIHTDHSIINTLGNKQYNDSRLLAVDLIKVLCGSDADSYLAKFYKKFGKKNFSDEVYKEIEENGEVRFSYSMKNPRYEYGEKENELD